MGGGRRVQVADPLSPASFTGRRQGPDLSPAAIWHLELGHELTQPPGCHLGCRRVAAEATQD